MSGILRSKDVVVALIESREKPEHFLVQYRRDHEKAYPNWLEFPGGKKEENENHTNALHREIREEVGLTILGLRKIAIIDYLFPSGLYHNVHFYEVSKDNYEGNPIGAEGQRIGWLTLWQIMSYPRVLPLNRAAALILTTERHPDILE